ncbi:TetR/AcrR family transcriptional regulator [Defluviimonas salinarum]|nr:TetR/AcrR family transcriptional regulator [Defluviimonas salinarum]
MLYWIRMPSLRERQKTKRRERILRAAVSLFQSQGFQATTLEQIAVSAEISTGTIYNYFRNKAELLIAIVDANAKAAYEIGLKVVENPPADPVEAVELLTFKMCEGLLDPLTKEMWREAVAIVISQPHTQFATSYMDNYNMVEELQRKLLQALMDQGLFRPDVDVMLIGDMLSESMSMRQLFFFRDDDADLDDLIESIRQRTRALIGLIAVGNEVIRTDA